MDLTVKITALCVVGAVLALVVKKGSPEQTLVLLLCASAVGLWMLADSLREIVALLQELAERSDLPSALFVPLYKTVGIGLTVRLGGALCRDAGSGALAALVETAGTVCALLAALPLLRAVLELVMEWVA